MELTAWARRHLPVRLARLVEVAVGRPLETIRHGYRKKRWRSGPLDYVTEFDHRSLQDAMGSILWHGHWEEQTAATLQVLRTLDLVHDNQTVIDYGCGIGRISRDLLEAHDVRLTCVERSPQMRRHFRRYVGASPRASRALASGRVRLWSDDEFLRAAPGMAGTVDVALLIEVVQHIPEPVLDTLFPPLVRILSPHGKVFVFGNRNLDVDSNGRLHSTPVEAFLDGQKGILVTVRKDVWEEVGVGASNFRFEFPRYSYLLARRI